MTVNDLKTGMSVITRNGKHYLVIKANDWESEYEDTSIVGIGESGFIIISSEYDNNLYHKHATQYDIMEIRKIPINNCHTLVSGVHTLKLHRLVLWQRKEAVEMTLEQVCKELGKEIKLIK